MRFSRLFQKDRSLKKVFFVSHVYYSNATDLKMSGLQWACCMYIQDSAMRNSQKFNVTVENQMLISLPFGSKKQKLWRKGMTKEKTSWLNLEWSKGKSNCQNRVHSKFCGLFKILFLQMYLTAGSSGWLLPEKTTCKVKVWKAFYIK